MTMNERGVLHFPLAAALGIAAIVGLSLLGALWKWRKVTEAQLRIDRCVAETALSLKDRLAELESANDEIRIIRAALLVDVEPSSRATLTAALNLEVARQEMIRSSWETRRITWLAQRGCDGRFDVAHPLPAMPWTRDPPDSIGPKPLRWTGSEPKRMELRLSHYRRRSAARVEKREKEGIHDLSIKAKWRAKWTSFH